MTDFRKSETCPSSERLLAFQRGELSAGLSAGISLHLGRCEFCIAEIEFYSHYPQREESVDPEPIPAPLFDLARALLRRGRSSLAWIDSVLHTNSKSN
jgi:hypothetical protein